MKKLKTSLAFNLSHQDNPTWILPIEKDLVDDLRSVGLDVFTIDQLLNTSDSYPEAISVLIKHLKLNNDRNILMAIIRSLTVKEAKGVAFEPIYEMYIKDDDTGLHGAKFAMANALQYLAEKKDLSRIIELALDKKNGPTRVAFVDKIASSATKENVSYIKSVLEELAKDNENYIDVRAKKALQRKKFQ